MESTVKSPVLIYTEQTPNPESLKFVTNRMLYRGTADFQERELAEKWSPIASTLFEFPYVKGVYLCNNFITVTKEMNYSWDDLMLRLKEFIKQYVADGGELVSEGYEEAMAEVMAKEDSNNSYTGEEAVLVKKIKDLLNTYVKPAVEMDGGNIEFKEYNDGIVTVKMQGACSGCPSSTVTLQAGIEGMLKRMIPEVRQVVSEMA
jgi:Fe-S cluster biogenesis protein NfuA